jgi:hypothetical protein
MAQAPKKNPDQQRLFTPRGTLKWPKLNEPDHGTEKFPCKHEAGEYKTKLVLDRADPGVEAFLAKIDKAMERAEEIAEAEFLELPLKSRKTLEAKGGISKDLPYQEIYDEETEEPTGKVELLFKMAAGGNRKKDGKPWSAQPDLFDAKGKPLNRKISIWGGSVAIINFDLTPYFMPGTGKWGLSRRLNAAQIVELVSSGGTKSASSYGFGTEDGFDSGEYSDEDSTDEDGEDQTTGDGGDEADPNF